MVQQKAAAEVLSVGFQGGLDAPPREGQGDLDPLPSDGTPLQELSKRGDIKVGLVLRIERENPVHRVSNTDDNADFGIELPDSLQRLRVQEVEPADVQ